MTAAYDAVRNNFLVACFVGWGTINGTVRVIISRLDPSTNAWDGWVELHAAETDDKPYICSGYRSEFYIVWHESGPGARYHYRRTTTGGLVDGVWDAEAWNGGEIVDEATDDPISSNAGKLQPGAYGASRLYCVYYTSSTSLRLLGGRDSEGSLVTFGLLRDESDDPLEIPLNRPNTTTNSAIPGGFDSRTIPHIAVNPADNDTFYVVYHDSADTTTGAANMNVYMRRCHRQDDYWELSERLLINLDPAQPSACSATDETDQFLPVPLLDGQDRLHVFYYDDSNYCQLDSEGTAGQGRFDMIHAIVCEPFATSQSISYERFLSLASCPEAPCEAFLDCPADIPQVFGPLHYNYAGFVDLGETTLIWTALTGTNSDLGTDSDKSCIYSIWAEF